MGRRCLPSLSAASKISSRAIKVVVNRLLLTALVASELQIQFGTISYSIVESTRQEMYAWRGIVEEALDEFRQRGVPRILATASMYPSYWIVIGMVGFCFLMLFGGFAELELVSPTRLTLWMRDNADFFYLLSAGVALVLVGLPWLLRWLYPYAIVNVGWESRHFERLTERRKNFLWVVVVGLFIGVLATALYEHLK